MKNFIKGFRFTPSNYPAAVEEKIQKYRKQGYKLPPRKVLRTPEQLEGIRESAKINTALLDYISENIREGMSTEEIDVMVYDFTTAHGAIPAPLSLVEKLEKQDERNKEIALERTVEDTKKQILEADITGGKFSADEDTMLYFFLLSSLRKEHFAAVGIAEEIGRAHV